MCIYILTYIQVGTHAVAETSYIGGYEGATEYWWMRISPEGKRTQVTEPRAVLLPLVPPLPVTTAAGDAADANIEPTTAATAANADPRLYFLTAGG